jgi:hypothetical protein
MRFRIGWTNDQRRKKTRASWAVREKSALASLEAGILLVDDIGPSAPPNHATILVALLERPK